eukprot:evm.model.scf_1831.1 EVM.evm.TU.scf_1831.1   scf_1831:95-8359(-)
MLRLSTARSLLIIDEFGKGTLTSDGVGLLCSILGTLSERSDPPKVIACTHFSEVMDESCLPRNPQLQFSTMHVLTEGDGEGSGPHGRGNHVTLYKLMPGYAAPSFGVHCAKQAGVEEDVLRRALELIHKRASGGWVEKMIDTRQNARDQVGFGAYELVPRFRGPRHDVPKVAQKEMERLQVLRIEAAGAPMERAEGGPGAPAPVTRARGDPPANPPRAPAPETSEGARRKAFKARVAVLKRDFMARKLERMATEVRAAHALIPDLVAGVESGIRRRPSAPFNASAQGDPSGDDHGSGPAGEGKNEGEDGVAAGSVSDAGNEDGRRDPWQLPLNKVVRVKMRGGGKGGGWVRVQYRANRIPRCNTIPPYSAWLYITQNASNQDNDKRMFYTDETGESVPASDEEGQSWASCMWNGYDSDWRVFCVEMMVEEALEGGGDKGAVVGLLADKFKVEAEIVDARAKEVERRRAPKPDPEDLSVEETLHKVKGFCRRCRKFECVLHGREPIEPHLKPPPLRLEPSEACGPNCFMVRSRKRRGGKDERDVGGGAGKRARHSSASPTAARGGMAV